MEKLIHAIIILTISAFVYYMAEYWVLKLIYKIKNLRCGRDNEK